MKEYTSQRWICVQKLDNGRHWYYEPSTSYIRKDSIKECVRGTTLTWRQLKDKYKWSCIKVKLTLTPLS